MCANIQKYDHYISLGSTCEIGFQIRRVLGCDNASFFLWNITDWATLLRILRGNFHDALNPANIMGTHFGLYTDRFYGFHYHGSFLTQEPRHDPNFEQKAEEDRSKFEYLAGKFRQQMSDDSRVVLFYRPHDNLSPARQNAIDVRDALLTYAKPGKDFTLVVLQSRDMTEQDWEEPNISNMYLRRYAPGDDASDGHCQSYDEVFARFPHKAPMTFVHR